jgi:hypothetical protein
VQLLIDEFKLQQQKRNNSNWTLYCFTFAHLRGFYESFGFKEQKNYVGNEQHYPEYVRAKMDACNEKYGLEKIPFLILKSNEIQTTKRKREED